MEDFIHLILGLCRLYDNEAARRREKLRQRAQVNGSVVLRFIDREIRRTRDLCIDLFIYLPRVTVFLLILFLIHREIIGFLLTIAVVYLLAIVASLLCWLNKCRLRRQIIEWAQ